MASYLLHGLWLPVSGLSLWIEQVEGHKIVMPSAVPEGTFPDVVDTILSKKTFRNRARVSPHTEGQRCLPHGPHGDVRPG